MQMYETSALQAAWKAKGNPPCDHPHIVREKYLGTGTGDKVCTTCGEEFPMGKID